MEVAPSYNTSFGFAALPQSVAMTHNIGSSLNTIARRSLSLRESPVPLHPTQSVMTDLNSPTDSDSFALSPSTTDETSQGTYVVCMSMLGVQFNFTGSVSASKAIPVTLGVGSKVIAKWKDKCWYVATVVERGKQGRYVKKVLIVYTGCVHVHVFASLTLGVLL